MAAGFATGGGRPAANRPRSPQAQVEPLQREVHGDSGAILTVTIRSFGVTP